MIGGPNHPDLANKIWGEIYIVRQMNKVLSIQRAAKKQRQGQSEPGNNTFNKADLERVQYPHNVHLVIQLWVHNYDVQSIHISLDKIELNFNLKFIPFILVSRLFYFNYINLFLS